MNPSGFDGVDRQRWSTGYAISLSTLLVPLIFLVTEIIGMTGRGYQVALVVQLSFAFIAIVVASMAAESLAWRLSRFQRRALLAVTSVLALLILEMLLAQFFGRRLR